jgi:hypothetical protein
MRRRQQQTLDMPPQGPFHSATSSGNKERDVIRHVSQPRPKPACHAVGLRATPSDKAGPPFPQGGLQLRNPFSQRGHVEEECRRLGLGRLHELEGFSTRREAPGEGARLNAAGRPTRGAQCDVQPRALGTAVAGSGPVKRTGG